jgi:hypothetical protein
VFFTPPEAAEFLGVTPARLAFLRLTLRCYPYLKLGNGKASPVRYRIDDIYPEGGPQELPSVAWLNSPRLARLFRLHPGALDRWRCDGMGVGPEYIRIGEPPRCRIQYPIEVVAQYIEDHMVYPTPRRGDKL